MDPDNEFEIDTMILDYMCSKAILETITKRAEELAGRPPIEETNILTLFDTWKTLASAKHAQRQISHDLQTKLQLITVAVQFVYRLRNSKWRAPRDAENKNDNTNSHAQPDTNTNTATATATNADFAALLDGLEIPAPERASDRQQITTLLDILPDLTKLCALLPDEILPLESRMHLAARFMLQCVLEQYTVFGNASAGLVEHAFSSSWWTPEGAEDEWSAVRSAYLAILQQDDDDYDDDDDDDGEGDGHESLLVKRIARVAHQLPAFEFEATVTARLREILDRLDTPLLVKLETGQLGDWDPMRFTLHPRRARS